MFGFKKCNDCDYKSIDNNDRFNDKLALKRMQLHRNYVCIILVSVIVWLVATGTYKDVNFPELVSFASTIASIILSVIAIIMSISGENKTDAIRNDLLETARKLDIVSEKINSEATDTNDEIKELIKELEKQIQILGKKIDDVPENVVKYKNTNSTYANTNTMKNKKIEWGKNDEKR